GDRQDDPGGSAGPEGAPWAQATDGRGATHGGAAIGGAVLCVVGESHDVNRSSGPRGDVAYDGPNVDFPRVACSAQTDRCTGHLSGPGCFRPAAHPVTLRPLPRSGIPC